MSDFKDFVNEIAKLADSVSEISESDEVTKIEYGDSIIAEFTNGSELDQVDPNADNVLLWLYSHETKYIKIANLDGPIGPVILKKISEVKLLPFFKEVIVFVQDRTARKPAEGYMEYGNELLSIGNLDAKWYSDTLSGKLINILQYPTVSDEWLRDMRLMNAKTGVQERLDKKLDIIRKNPNHREDVIIQYEFQDLGFHDKKGPLNRSRPSWTITQRFTQRHD